MARLSGRLGGRWEGVLDRYTMVAARSSAEATILDTESGREVTVGLCDLNGAIAALKAFG